MSEENQNEMEFFLKVQQTFLAAVSTAEIAVLRELVLELLKDNQRLAAQATDAHINQRIYEQVNTHFAALSDLHPSAATMFSKLLERWKVSHGIK